VVQKEVTKIIMKKLFRQARYEKSINFGETPEVNG
jgi:hypothetical protein